MYTLPGLEYDYSALGKYISGDIMKLHHDKHHQAYVDKLNKGLEGASELAELPLEWLLGRKDLPDIIRNNGGGHYNHTLFWQWMSPSGGGEPGGMLGSLIEQKYSSFQGFTDEFTDKALGVFGSGWVWLQPDLEIITTPNQDTPMLLGKAEPILGLDVWEHAYYLDYKNVRADYVAAWWNVVNWDFVAERYTKLHGPSA
jgi:Fe-Mn family superoxide dismutase